MSTLLDMVTAEEVLPIEEPLKAHKDEMAAELLALTGTATGAAKESNGKLTANMVYKLVNGYTGIGPKRAAMFRGRVKYKLQEMQDELRARRLSLGAKAAGAYDKLLDQNVINKRPEVAAMVAKDTLHGIGFFGNEDEDGKVEAPQLKGRKLTTLTERMLLRRKRREKKEQDNK